jgi:hypothetical protein
MLMPARVNSLHFFLLAISCLSINNMTIGQGIAIEPVQKDSIYSIRVLYNKVVLAVDETPFSIYLSNIDGSSTANFSATKAIVTKSTRDEIHLNYKVFIPALTVDLFAEVVYKLVNENVVRKSVRLFQPSMPGLKFILEEKTSPVTTPKLFVTFEENDFPGGLVHEMFPAMGFITPSNEVVAVLTDAGYKNQYTRNTRRRFTENGGGFVGMRKLPDAALFSISDSSDNKKSNYFLKQTYGEYYDLDIARDSAINLKEQFKSRGDLPVFIKENNISFTGKKNGPSGVEAIIHLPGQHIYSISFQAKGNTPLKLKLFRVKNGRKTIELEDGIKYIDNFPTDSSNWKEFKGSILIPYIGNDDISIFLGPTANTDVQLEIKDLNIVQHQVSPKPYNILPLGDTVEKISYVFIEPWQSHQQFMISCQTRLAEGMNFQGSAIEKMMYANVNMLTWISDINDFSPFLVPNMNYAPDMYNRDTYFSVVATYNKNLNIKLWEKWGKTQTANGAIGTIITPSMGSVEVKDNEATILWLQWALLNKRRFNIELPKEKIDRAVNYVLNEFDPDRDGVCEAYFPLNQIDVINYEPKTHRLAANQGIFAVALKTIKALGYNEVSDEYINRAVTAYRNFYDPVRKHLLFDTRYPDLISLTDLEPEFLSIWLFNEKMLTDEMVTNHLDRMPLLNKNPKAPHPELGTTAPILIRVNGRNNKFSYFTKAYQPFEKFGEENYIDGRNDGYYYNGGSWLRPEYCAYVTGLKHGWDKALSMMENRVWAEVNLNPAWPFSKEFIPTKWMTTDSWWPSTKGLSWNIFILIANEVAGFRKPGMDQLIR